MGAGLKVLVGHINCYATAHPSGSKSSVFLDKLFIIHMLNNKETREPVGRIQVNLTIILDERHTGKPQLFVPHASSFLTDAVNPG